MHSHASTGAFAAGPGAMPAASAQVIERAHQRSTAFGLRREQSADLQPLARDALAFTVARNEALCAHARPVMETLSAQIAGTQSMVLLTDAEGVILHALGDDEFVGRARRVALRPGATWAESSKGTNAIGTALALGEALQVNGTDHFLKANDFLTCSCAPILDPQGRVIGALDVSGDHRSQSPHTMALVRMSAKMVENHLFAKVFEDAVRLRFHARPEFIGTLVEGLAAFTPDGRFLAANRSGQFQLGLSAEALSAHTFASLFGLPMSTVLAHARHGAAAGLLTLKLPGGVAVRALAEYAGQPATLLWQPPDAPANPPTLQHRERATQQPAAPAGASGRPARARPAPQGLSSLRYLDTGDAQLAVVIERVTRLLGRDVPTLILGETGTGKELLARAIHHDGPRARQPFVAVNCASIPETLIEAELFGYEEGAFTGARRKGSVGKIVQAHGGTLFLDEIGDMPLPLQARLLRVLQERSVAPLGATRQVDVDVHIVCATHRNLRDMMAQGSFRTDLYYRLNGLVVRLPALRERTDLAVVMARLLRAQMADDGLPATSAVPRIAPDVMALFEAHAWPGNLRQLHHVLRTAALLAEGEDCITMAHLPDDFMEECQAQRGPARAAVHASAPGEAPGAHTLAGPGTPLPTEFAHPAHPAHPAHAAQPARAVPLLGETTHGALQQALAVHGGNVSAAARALGVSRNTVYRHLRAARPQR